MAVNDELTAFHNHTNFGKNTQRAFLFAGSSYESVIEELKTQDEKRNEKLIRYGEAYRCFMRRFICFPAMRPVRSSFKLWPYLITV